MNEYNVYRFAGVTRCWLKTYLRTHFCTFFKANYYILYNMYVNYIIIIAVSYCHRFMHLCNVLCYANTSILSVFKYLYLTVQSRNVLC